MKLFFALILKDLRLDVRQNAQIIFMPCYFILMALLFPLAFGPSAQTLSFLAPGLIVLAALLATLNGLDALYLRDFETGFIETLFLAKTNFVFYSAAALCAHFILSALPLLLCAPFIGLALGLPPEVAFWPTLPVLAVALICLTLIGGIVRALTLGATQSRLLIAPLCLPLFIPPLIFAISALNLAYAGLAYASPLLFLCALTLVFMLAAPYVTAVLLRWSLRS